MTSLVDHLESHLGRIEVGWSESDEGEPLPFQVVRFSGGPVEGCRVFSTLGLSRYPLLSRVSHKMIRHELVLLARRGFGDKNLPGLLQQLGLECLKDNTAYLRGDVIGPRGVLFDGSTLQALYVAMPAYFPDSFASFQPAEGEAVVMVWLVPISAGEALFVRERGWQSFEDALLRYDPDLSDFTRPPLSLAG